jgi:hypothetical protein
MTKRKLTQGAIVGLLVLLIVVFFIKVGWILVGEQDVDKSRMGYCFDVATDLNGSRLFVAAGKRGMHLFDIFHGELHYARSYHDDGYYRNLKVSGDRIFLADSERGLVVLDISGESPHSVWIEGEGRAYGVHIEADMAYVAAHEDGLKVFDISNPDTPLLIGALSTGDYSWDVWVHDGYAYLADLNTGVSVIDVSSPERPRLIGSVSWSSRYPSSEVIRGEGDTVFVAAGNRGLIAIDVSDPANPKVASKYRPLRIGAAEGLYVRDGIVYLAQGSELEIKIGGFEVEISTTIDNGLHIIDAQDPYSIRLVGKIGFLGWVEGVHLFGDYAYVANTWNGVRSIDVSDIYNPSLVDSFQRLP